MSGSRLSIAPELHTLYSFPDFSLAPLLQLGPPPPPRPAGAANRLLTETVLVKDAMDAIRDHYGFATKVTTKLDKSGLQISGDSKEMSHLYAERILYRFKAAANLVRYDPRPGINRLIDRTLFLKESVLVQKGFLAYASRPKGSPPRPIEVPTLLQ